MDSSTTGIIIAIGINIIITAFSAGKLWQKVNDLCHRVDRLEKKVDNTDTHLDNLSDRISNLEGRIR